MQCQENRADREKNRSMERMRSVLDRILERETVPVSTKQLEEETTLRMLEYRHRLQYESMTSGLCYAQMQEDAEELYQKFREEALRELQEQKLLQMVIQREKLEVSRKELEEEAMALAARQDMPLEMVKGFLGEEYGMLKEDLLEKKAREFLLGKYQKCWEE